MIKELMHDPIFLASKSEIATKEELPVAQDLLDTLMAHKDSCVGMAANMIGVKKRIIAFLAEQKRLLTIKKNRLERLIEALEQAEKGEITMSAFDNSEYETARQQYEDEAKQRWGNTDAYKESQAKTAGYSKDNWNDVLAGLNGVFAEFSECKNCGESADSDTAQRLVKKLQDYITANFYHCTDDILAGLGQMYVCDERFKNNIDKNGEGTAEFVSEAIKIYCGK